MEFQLKVCRLRRRMLNLETSIVLNRARAFVACFFSHAILSFTSCSIVFPFAVVECLCCCSTECWNISSRGSRFSRLRKYFSAVFVSFLYLPFGRHHRYRGDIVVYTRYIGFIVPRARSKQRMNKHETRILSMCTVVRGDDEIFVSLVSS